MTLTDNSLIDAELILDELAARIPAPVGVRSIGDLAGRMFAARAVDIHRGFIHALEGRSHSAPTVLVRPLVELAILVHWIAEDPDHNFPAWTGHSDSQDAKALREMAKHLPRPPGDPYSPEEIEKAVAAKEALVAQARIDSGRITGVLKPGLTEMIEGMRKHDPGEALALWQAYDDGYRATSPTTHSEATSFKANIVEHPDGRVDYVETEPIPRELLRYLAAGCLAYAIEAAAELTDESDIGMAARALRLDLARPTSEYDES